MRRRDPKRDPKRISIGKDRESGYWVIVIENAPIMGSRAWQHTTWAECILHADVLRLVWGHI